jgi:hypothetical protein
MLNGDGLNLPFHYKRIFVPTGKVWNEPFTIANSAMLGSPHRYLPAGSPRESRDVAERLIKGWNCDPTRWRYELVEGPAPTNKDGGFDTRYQLPAFAGSW